MEAKKTEKIRLTVRREEVKELEISFPYYVKDNWFYCKFFSVDNALWVCDYGFNRSIQWADGAVPEIWLTFDQITEEEFNAKFNEVINALKERNNEKAI